MKADERILKQLYRSKSPREAGDIYDQWAESYDTDLNDDSDYVAPQRCLSILERYVPEKEARLLDAGAGTGLFGALLDQRGYHNMVGTDISPGMLEVARKKAVYRELHQKVLGEPLGFSNDVFDGVICVGVFSPGQGPSSAFDELIRIIKPGGYFIFTLRPEFYEDKSFGFKPKQLALEAEGKWTLVEKTEKFQGLPKGEPDLYYNAWVYRINADQSEHGKQS